MSYYYDSEDDRQGLSRSPRNRPPPRAARPGGIRRASTLPVRFGDERFIEEGVVIEEYRPRKQQESGPYAARVLDDTGEAAGIAADRPEAPIIINNYYGLDDDVKPRRGYHGRSSEPYLGRQRRIRSPSSPVKTRERIVERDRSDSPPVRVRERIIERERSISPAPYRSSLRVTQRDRDYLTLNQKTGEDYDESNPNAYAFRLSRHTRSPLSRGNSTGSLSDTSEPNTILAPPPSKSAPKVLYVSNARYSGDGTLGGIQSAELKTEEEFGQASQTESPVVFKWVPIDDGSMNLDRFESSCDSIPGLSAAQRAGVTKTFGRIRRKVDKPFQTPDGSKVRYMLPSVLQEPVPQGQNAKSAETQNITWMCLPYLTLQKYSGNLSGLAAASHPMRTLMQSRFSQARKERDMAQAVLQLQGSTPEYCFHIAQVWCLVIQNAFLITCSRTPIPQLVGGYISMSTTEPSPATEAKNSKSRPQYLFVSHGKLLWSFPLQECRTWFAFKAHFWQYLPYDFVVLHREKPIAATDWATFIDRASKRNTQVSLKLKSLTSTLPKGTLAYPDIIEPSADAASPGNDAVTQERGERPPGGLQPDQSRGRIQAKVAAKSPHGVGKIFHVFTWLNERQPTSWATTIVGDTNPDSGSSGNMLDAPFRVDDASLKSDLEEIDWFLAHGINFEERIIYCESTESSRKEISEILSKEEQEVAALAEADLERRRDYEDMVDLVNKAETVFQFFLPSKFEGPTVGKFWGAIKRLLEALSAPPPQGPEDDDAYYNYRPLPRSNRIARHIPQIIIWLRDFAATFEPFVSLLSHANPSDRSAIAPLPEDLANAWLPFLMGLIFGSTEKTVHLFADKSTICRQLVVDGYVKTIDALNQKSLVEYLVFKPSNIASLINFAVLGDITGQSLDASQTYFEYLSNLELAIEGNPLDRGHQDKITYFQQEISVIVDNLHQQRRVLATMQDLEGYHPWEVKEALADFPSRTRDTLRPQPSTRPIYYSQGDQNMVPNRSPYIDRLRREDDELDIRINRSRIVNNRISNGDSPYYESPLPARTSTIGSYPRTPGQQLDPTDPNGVQGLLIQESRALIDKKLREFEEMAIRATELATENLQKIDYNRDRQENAIYAFTIVTIIFLPLSAVASILGMNVNDVRNMQLNQWVFWVTALPLTVIIITLCLIWAGELENFWKGFQNLWSRQRRGGGGNVSHAYSMMDPRADEARIRTRVFEGRGGELRERYRPLYGRARQRSGYYDDDDDY